MHRSVFIEGIIMMEPDIEKRLSNPVDKVAYRYQQTRMAHWDAVARQMDAGPGWGAFYHERLAEIYRFLVPKEKRVIELGCAQGELLAAFQPARGVGVDFSSEMLTRGKQRFPKLTFIQADVHDLAFLNEKFDVIILSDLVNDLWDVQAVFEQVAKLAESHTRIIINSYSRLWELPLALGAKLGLTNPKLNQNWLTVEDVSDLLTLTDFEPIRHWEEILWPLATPLLAPLTNRYLVKFWPFKMLALTNFIVARTKNFSHSQAKKPVVSVIVPARNEAGNIPPIMDRTPEMGAGTELIFVEGHSKDNTYAAIEAGMAQHPERNCKLFRQTGVGKGDAVRLGFSQATGEILMILDADLTVPPEDLPRFVAALLGGKAEFVNGVRLVYPMEERAMRFLNLMGNKFFSLAFSWLLGQPIKDTLCGTKVLWKSDYHLIEANRDYFGDFDPFGDYDLLFGAAKLNLRIIDLPIRYRERTYGDTNIQRWRHGWLLLKMVAFAARRIKFI
jgi:SAM-dependent methyltransferase